MTDIYDDLDVMLAGYQHPADDAAARKATIDLLRRWHKALHDQDIDALPSLMTDDVVIELPFSKSGRVEPGHFRVFTGTEQVLGFWRAAFQAEKAVHGLMDCEFTMSADGAVSFLEARGHLTMANGNDYRNRYVMRVDVRDGKIAKVREYYNPVQSAFAFRRPVAGQFILEHL